MCQIILCDKNKPSRAYLEDSWQVNKNGAGIAWFKGPSLRFIKGIMKFKEFINIFYKVPHPCVVHFRQATSGTVMPQLTHPFVVGLKTDALDGQAKAVLFHNGHCHDEACAMLRHLILRGIKVPDTCWSDSKMIAFVLEHTSVALLNFIPGSKFVYMRVGNEIKTFGAFHKKEGFQVSTEFLGHRGWKYLGV